MKKTFKSYTLAIVGARSFNDKETFLEGILQVLEKWGRPSSFVSGGARGADTMGEKWARANNIPVTILKPEWKKYGKSAGIRRNTDIVALCDKVLGFPNKNGRGTQDTIRKAKKSMKECIVIFF